MHRLLLTETGDCFGRFADGSTVFLSSSCQIVVETGKNNKQITHIINFINDNLKQKVEQIVNIRNKYFSPISFPPFMQQTNGYKKLLSPITQCIWTPKCQQNVENQAIKSRDGHTVLKLHKNQHQISISYPISLKKDVTVTPNGSSLIFYHHIQQTQIQSIYNHDICWGFPLHLIQNKSESNKNPQKTLNIINKTPLPQIQQNSLQKTMSKLSEECMKSIEYFHCMENGIPPNEIIIVEWTLNIVHRIFNSPNYLIETFISFDHSYLISNENQQFIYHYIPIYDKKGDKTKTMEYVYSTNAIPPIPPDTKQEDATYDLCVIAQNGLNLLQNAYNINRFKQTATSNNISLEYGNILTKQNKTKDEEMSNEIKNYYINPKFGEFMYYEDKRVRVHFSDRTLLELSGDWKTYTIITRYGEEIKNIECNNSIKQFSKYIQHALNYANWCSLSKAEQLNHKQNQLKIQNDIQKQINFSQRLVETQQITKNQDYSMLYGINDIESDEQKININVNNDKLIESIQSQLNDIDKLLQ